MAKAILIGGTGSHAGKSWMATAICRWLRRRGVRVAPFKAQNMSLNSYPCRGGGEIGRAQVVQAEACGLEPVSDMNPILLKPNSHTGSQVIVDGRVWRNLSAREYYVHFDFLLSRVLAAFERLAAQYEYIVIEGAGSIAELNLKQTDLVNLGLAKRLNVPALLVADIDRGGVFASVIGTFCVLDPDERKLVRSFAVNRFRGDCSLFQEGVEILEARSGSPCLGVFPFADDIEIDAEDSVSLDEVRPQAGTRPRIAILRLPRTSNFTDFRLLPDAVWVSTPMEQQFDWVVLPGTKNTIADLHWLRERRLDEWLKRQQQGGAQILGICGGYQMLGLSIEDPHGVESDSRSAEGLGFLPVTTVLEREKTIRVVEARTLSGRKFRAYEIHMGLTERPPGCTPFALIEDYDEGIRLNGCIGTYLHGALEDPAVVEELLGRPIPGRPSRETAYDRLADWFEANANIPLFEELYLS